MLNRLTKDIDTLDNTLADALRMLISTIAGVIGTIVLIAIVEPYFLIAVVVVAIVYGHLAAWYQRSALMFKRIDAVLRSPLYAHFSESLSGVTVIRAYGEGDRFIADNQKLMAIETRAYYLTVANQRWLGIRLDALGSVLVFVVAVIVACSDTISPASSGLVRNVIRGFSTRLNVLPLSDIIVFRHSSTVVLLDRSSVCGSAE